MRHLKHEVVRVLMEAGADPRAGISSAYPSDSERGWETSLTCFPVVAWPAVAIWPQVGLPGLARGCSRLAERTCLACWTQSRKNKSAIFI